MSEAVRIISKFAGVCKGCNKGIVVGEPIVWKAGEGAWHDGCYGQSKIPRPTTPYVHDRLPRGPSPRQRLREQAQEQLHSGYCDLCEQQDVIGRPIVVGPSRITRFLCQTCIEEVSAYGRKPPY